MNLSSLPTLIPVRWAQALWVAQGLTAIIVAWWTMEAYYWSNFPDRAVYRDRYSNPLIVLSIFVNAAVCLALTAYGYGVLKSPPLWVPALGMTMALLGLWLRFLSIRLLGNFYTSRVALQPDQKLVDGGVFGYIRHPAYTGALLLGFGMSLALANWWACLFFAGTHVPAILYRIRVEEQVLREHFGEQFRAYMARTWALIPYLY